MNIAVLAGGLSPERDVSLSSGSLIANALIRCGHRAALIDLYYDIDDYYAKNPDELFSDKPDFFYIVPETEPNLEDIIKNNGGKSNAIGKNVLHICQAADIVFVALHGSVGENGSLSATFDNYGIKYTGSSFIGCLLSMDKDISKKMLRDAKIPTAEWINIIKNDYEINEIENKIGYPCVIKPCSCGSSVGVSIVHDRSELENAFGYAFKYEDSVLAEKFISGREFSVGVLCGKALPPIEIIPKTGFYDYKNKYQKGLSEEICPALLSEKETEKIKQLALDVHKTLRLGTYSRIDFILSEEGFFCLEANSLPGMTPTSLFPQEAAAAGIPYDSLCEIIIKASL